jgi:hypothetical protein
MPIKAGSTVYNFRNWFRPVEIPPPGVMPVRIVEGPQVEPEEIPSVLRELNDRQFSAVREVLIEAKFKAAAQVRDEKVISDYGKLAYYSGWGAYADYVLASLEELRERAKELE